MKTFQLRSLPITPYARMIYTRKYSNTNNEEEKREFRGDRDKSEGSGRVICDNSDNRNRVCHSSAAFQTGNVIAQTLIEMENGIRDGSFTHWRRVDIRKIECLLGAKRFNRNFSASASPQLSVKYSRINQSSFIAFSGCRQRCVHTLQCLPFYCRKSPASRSFRKDNGSSLTVAQWKRTKTITV